MASMARRMGLTAVGVAVSALMISGCAGAAEPVASSAAVDESAILDVGVRILPGNWDPENNPAPAGNGVLKLAYETLVSQDIDLALVPGLAESWVVADDGLSWDFSLVQDVVFSDGSAFNAEDAKASLDKYRAATSTLRNELAAVTDVVVVDDYTVRLVLSQPNYGLPATLTGRTGMMLSSEAVATGDWSTPIGTGQFVLDSQEPGVKLTYAKSDSYRDADSVRVAGLVVQAYEDPVAMSNALISGEVDMAILDPTQVESVTNAGIPTWNIRSAQLVTVVLNPNLEPAFADPMVRKALSMAIDREGIVASALFGNGEPADQFILSDTPGYNSEVEPLPYDPEGAKALLKEAGYGDGLSFRFVAQANNKTIAEALQANWAEIGVDLQLEFPPGLGTGEALFGAPPATPTAPSGIYNGQVEANVVNYLARSLSAKAPTNPGQIASPEVTELLTGIAAEPDEDQREAMVSEIQALVIDEPQGHLPIVFRYQTVGYSEQLVGVKEWQGIYPVVDGIAVAQ